MAVVHRADSSLRVFDEHKCDAMHPGVNDTVTLCHVLAVTFETVRRYAATSLQCQT
jgi:hypothetical protein